MVAVESMSEIEAQEELLAETSHEVLFEILAKAQALAI